ncbi:YfiR family protein [Niveibacterium microcysteis]|uniref:YfiR family protein n=1 Tax=Niveibacterium microcysteis TaxID=2811415 RepID=A0ABX7MC89_9RHOO|nr:YfiR family protein [Niveibacterium microcysteis]QSI78313.1 YfiR family protein [Niveibacterium microcysteis]
MSRCARLIRIGVLATALSVQGVVAHSAPLDAQVKAAYLINFTRYIVWPSNAGHMLCLVGADEVADWLERNQGKSGLPVRRLLEPAEVEGCTVLFLGRDSTQTRNWLNAARDRAILTVSEQGGFLQKGGVINLIPQGNTLRFEVNLDSAVRAKLQFSSRLLALAAHVEGGGQ